MMMNELNMSACLSGLARFEQVDAGASVQPRESRSPANGKHYTLIEIRFQFQKARAVGPVLKEECIDQEIRRSALFQQLTRKTINGT
jgi:hypothetical protein